MIFTCPNVGEAISQWSRDMRAVFSDATTILTNVHKEYPRVLLNWEPSWPKALPESERWVAGHGNSMCARKTWAGVFGVFGLLPFKLGRFGFRAVGVSEANGLGIGVVFLKMHMALFDYQPDFFSPFSRELSERYDKANGFSLLVDDFSERFDLDRWKRSPLSALFDAIGVFIGGVLTAVIAGSIMLLVKLFRLSLRAGGLSEAGLETAGLVSGTLRDWLFGRPAPGASVHPEPDPESGVVAVSPVTDAYASAAEAVKQPAKKPSVESFSDLWKKCFNCDRWKRSPISAFFDLFSVVCAGVLTLVFAGSSMLALKIFRLSTRAIGISEAAADIYRSIGGALYNLFFLGEGEDGRAHRLRDALSAKDLRELRAKPLYHPLELAKAAMSDLFNLKRFCHSPLSTIADIIGFVVVAIGTAAIGTIGMGLFKFLRLCTRAFLGISEAGKGTYQYVGAGLYNLFFADKGKGYDLSVFSQKISDRFSWERFYRSPLSLIADAIGVAVAFVGAAVVVGIGSLLLKTFRLCTRAFLGISQAGKETAYSLWNNFGIALFGPKDQWFLFASPAPSVDASFADKTDDELMRKSLELLSNEGANSDEPATGETVKKLAKEVPPSTTVEQIGFWSKHFNIDRWKRSPFSAFADLIGAGIVTIAFTCTVGLPMFLLKIIRLPSRMLGISEAGKGSYQYVGAGLYNLFFADKGQGYDLSVFSQNIGDRFTWERFRRSPLSLIADAVGVVVAAIGTAIVVGIGSLLLKTFRLTTRACLGISQASKETVKLLFNNINTVLFGPSEKWCEMPWIEPQANQPQAQPAEEAAKPKEEPIHSFSDLWKKCFNKERWKRSPFSALADLIGSAIYGTISFFVIGIPSILFKLARLSVRTLGVSYIGLALMSQISCAFYNVFFKDKDKRPYGFVVDNKKHTYQNKAITGWELVKNILDETFDFQRIQRSPLSAIADVFGTIIMGVGTFAVVGGCMLAFKIFRGLFLRLIGISEAGLHTFVGLVVKNLWGILNPLKEAAPAEGKAHEPAAEEKAAHPKAEDPQKTKNPITTFSELWKECFNGERWKRSPFSTVCDLMGSFITLAWSGIGLGSLTLAAYFTGLHAINFVRITRDLKDIYNMFVPRAKRYDITAENHILEEFSNASSRASRFLSHVNAINIVFKAVCYGLFAIPAAFILGLRLAYRVVGGIVSSTLGHCLPFLRTKYHADYDHLAPEKVGKQQDEPVSVAGPRSVTAVSADGHSQFEDVDLDDRTPHSERSRSSAAEAKGEALVDSTDTRAYLRNLLVILRNSLDHTGKLTENSFTDHLKRGPLGRFGHAIVFEFGQVMRLATRSLHEDLITHLTTWLDKYQAPQGAVDNAGRFLFFRAEGQPKSHFQTAVDSFKRKCQDKFDQADMDTAAKEIQKRIETRYSAG